MPLALTPPNGAAMSICAARRDRRLEAVAGIEAGEQRVVVSLSVSFRSVCGMSKRRFRRTPGGVCWLDLHLVWCPKYPHRILGGRVAARSGELLDQIVAKEVMPDHVHLVVRVGPIDAPAAVVPAFKGRTARVLCAEFPYLRNRAKVLWSPLYFAASVGYVSESAVHRCVGHQWDGVAS
jgi:REP-associated tyrosine transposase